MKSVLLYANDDNGLETRLQAALDVTAAFDGHLTCLQVTPHDTFIMGDPFGGIYASPQILNAISQIELAHREKLEADLANESVPWNWMNETGQPAAAIADQARLADLVVLSLCPRESGVGSAPVALAGIVALHTSSLVLGVPPQSKGFDCGGPAVIAWNGSPESCHALRLALPILRKASAVHLVCVSSDETRLPSIAASEYLSRYNIPSEIHERAPGDRSVAETLVGAAQELDACCLVSGAYGHSRLREAVMGGVTRALLEQSPVPLLLAH